MKKQIIYKCCGLLISIFLFTGCLETVSTDIPDDRLPSEGYVTVTVQVPGTNAPSTYASITEDQEDEIQQLDVLAFIEEGGEDLFSYRVPIAPKEILSAGNKKTFTIHLKRLNEGVKLMVLANSSSVLNSLAGNTLVEGVKKQDLIEELTYSYIWNNLDNFSDQKKGFPMWGETANEINATLLEQNGSSISEEVKLLRALARIDVGVDIYGDPAIGFGKRFKLQKIHVYRTNDKGRIVPDVTKYEAGEPTLIPSPTGNYIFDYERTEEDENLMARSIYIAEAEKGDAGQPDKGVCLVIEASLDDNPATFYRIDFIDKDGNFLPILRNHKYQINITNIAGSGYASADEASVAKSASIQYGLAVEDESINNIVFNDQYMLGLGEVLLTMDWEAGAENTLNISTNYEGGWSLAVNESTSWLELKQDEDIEAVTIGNIKTYSSKKSSTQITIRAKSQNQVSMYREDTLTFKAGVLENKVTIRQRMGANCIMIYPGGEGKIPVVFANADVKDGEERIKDSGSYTYQILWKDQAGLTLTTSLEGSGKNSVIRVGTNNVKGNALIAVKEQGTVLWSWHIWVTDYTPDENAQPGKEIKYNNGTVFMDRNLGAYNTYHASQPFQADDPFGLMYQWGRKDPFPGATASTTPNSYDGRTIYDKEGIPVEISYQPVDRDKNFDQALAYPMTFYTSAQGPYYDWMGLNDANNHLWADKEGNKTAYDPCPAGWRVPMSGSGNLSPWYGLTPAANNWETLWGWNWEAAGFYPAAGGRVNDTGAFSDVGIRGYVWSASPVSNGAYLFRYGSSQTAFRTDGSAYRSNAYPVRCARE